MSWWLEIKQRTTQDFNCCNTLFYTIVSTGDTNKNSTHLCLHKGKMNTMWERLNYMGTKIWWIVFSLAKIKWKIFPKGRLENRKVRRSQVRIMFREYCLMPLKNVRKLGKAKLERVVPVKLWRTFSFKKKKKVGLW